MIHVVLIVMGAVGTGGALVGLIQMRPDRRVDMELWRASAAATALSIDLMGHAAPNRRQARPAPPPMPPPAPSRLVPLHGEDDLIRLARAEYVEGRIEVEELEAAIEHILRGGRGTAEFPYLPVFRAPQMDRISEMRADEPRWGRGLGLLAEYEAWRDPGRAARL